MSTSTHYNPDWLSDDELVTNFVARQAEFNFLRDELAHAPLTGNVQHYLLIGLRGAGKTTLLKRLAVAIRRETALSDHLIALSFPEELYQVKNLADFWWAACDALVDELDRMKRDTEADRLNHQIEQGRRRRHDVELSDAGFQLLVQTCAGLQRRPVLLVDNLDMVFDRIDKSGRKLKNPHAPSYWALREALSTSTAPLVIGGSVRLSAPFTDYDKAFYDYFMPKRLGKLSISEVREVLERLADARGIPEIKPRLQARPGRIEALFELTGGNPRALGLIFDLLRNGPNGRAVEDFERLMDITTPYYKARIEDLSEQAQVVMHALAVHTGTGLFYGSTAAEIGHQSGLPTTTVSTQLGILENEGLVEKSTAHGRTQYRIAEQLFRLWLQMRSSRRIRHNVIGLTRFFEAMYDPEELHATIKVPGDAGSLAEAKFAFAVAGAGDISMSQRHDIEAYGIERLHQHLSNNGGNMDDFLPDTDPARTRQAAASPPTPTADWKTLMSEAVAAVSDKNLAAAEAALRQAVAIAPEETEPSIQLAVLLSRDLGQMDEAEKIVRRVISSDSSNVMAWLILSNILLSNRDRDQEAEAVIREAVAQAPDQASLNGVLAIFLDRRLGHYEEAEEYYKKSLALDPTSTSQWRLLARLLSSKTSRYDEAKRAWLKVIELGPEDSASWTELAALYSEKLHASEDAKAALGEAIRLAPSNATALTSLGILRLRSGEHDEAEQLLRKALEITPEYGDALLMLGIILSSRPHQLKEAVAVVQKAITHNGENPWYWALLASLLAEMNNEEEAVAALRKAAKFGQDDAKLWAALGAYQSNMPACRAEAESSLRKAIQLDPQSWEARQHLGRLQELLFQDDQALATYEEAAALDPSAAYPRARIRILRAKQLLVKAADAIKQGHPAGLRNALAPLQTNPDDIATISVSEEFIEGFLVPQLANPQDAAMVLNELRAAGYDKYARPLLLAFEAMMDNREDMLNELEPEIQGATKILFKRLQTGANKGHD